MFIIHRTILNDHMDFCSERPLCKCNQCCAARQNEDTIELCLNCFACVTKHLQELNVYPANCRHAYLSNESHSLQCYELTQGMFSVHPETRCRCRYSERSPGVGYVDDSTPGRRGWICKRCGETHTEYPIDEIGRRK